MALQHVQVPGTMVNPTPWFPRFTLLRVQLQVAGDTFTKHTREGKCRWTNARSSMEHRKSSVQHVEAFSVANELGKGETIGKGDLEGGEFRARKRGNTGDLHREVGMEC